MSRKTIRVEIPISRTDEFSKLLKAIVAQHQSLGNNSPLKNIPNLDMNVFDGNRTDADAKRTKSEKLKAESEDLMLQANTVYGKAEGQDIQSPGTLYNLVAIIRDILLLVYKGNEEALSQWGFKVVLGQAKSPVRKPK